MKHENALLLVAAPHYVVRSQKVCFLSLLLQVKLLERITRMLKMFINVVCDFVEFLLRKIHLLHEEL